MSRPADEAWFRALGAPLGTAERSEICAYLEGLGMDPSLEVSAAGTWGEAGKLCSRPAEPWWRAEEAERERLERSARLDPSDPEWLALNDELLGAATLAAASGDCSDPALIRVAAGGAAYAAYQARLARAADAPSGHPFLRKYALYCAGRWPLGVYGDRFAIF